MGNFLITLGGGTYTLGGLGWIMVVQMWDIEERKQLIMYGFGVNTSRMMPFCLLVRDVQGVYQVFTKCLPRCFGTQTATYS